MANKRGGKDIKNSEFHKPAARFHMYLFPNSKDFLTTEKRRQKWSVILMSVPSVCLVNWKFQSGIWTGLVFACLKSFQRVFLSLKSLNSQVWIWIDLFRAPRNYRACKRVGSQSDPISFGYALGSNLTSCLLRLRVRISVSVNLSPTRWICGAARIYIKVAARDTKFVS